MHRLIALLVLLMAVFTAGPVTAQQPPKRAITHIAGDLYRFQNNFHYAVFLVTPDGIIVTDPINKDAAAWLKDEIHKRFNKPIAYLVYSHDHRDHIAGGEVFADSAIVVAHENAKAAIIGEQRPTAVPAITFNDRLTITLGGKTVELIYTGPSHSNNMIIMHFPAERAVFAVDFIAIKRLPYRNLSDAYFSGWIEAIKAVEAMDFDILVPGHGPLGTKADATEHRAYLEALHDAVLQASRAGMSLEDMQQKITLDAFKHLGQYEAWLQLNIEGMYNQVSLHRRGN